MIDVRNAVKQIGGSLVLDGVSFSLAEGGMYGIIGPNGAGKSTLLSLLSGVETAGAGAVVLRGKSVRSYKRKDLARWIAVLQQEGLPMTAFTVREVVGMGRFPHQNWLGSEEKDAGGLIEHALATLGLMELAERRLSELSGGERQRVALAKVMVQEPE
ncbi:ABC transporter ATP-binding protein, partial [Paenibacillus darwinianus]